MNAAARMTGRRDHLQKVLNRIHVLFRAELLVQLDGELLLASLLRRPGADQITQRLDCLGDERQRATRLGILKKEGMIIDLFE